MIISLSLDHNPLPTHVFALAPGQQEAVEGAMQILDHRSKFVREHVDEIYWMKLREDVDDECITSASFPRWPGRIFLSNKALVHIPPNCIFTEPSLHALAENIFHEAIHQHVNRQVLEGKILVDEFESASMPKIEIAWRRDQEVRNQYWELDRAYHAACVYSGLLPLRKHFADGGVESFAEALAEGRRALTYLIERLKNHTEYFKLAGRETLERIRSQSYV